MILDFSANSKWLSQKALPEEIKSQNQVINSKCDFMVCKPNRDKV